MIDHAFRRKHIGGSDIAIILNLSPWTTPLELWELKTGISEPQEPNQFMIKGIVSEPIAREKYMEITGNLMTDTENQEWEKHSFCSISLDGINMEKTIALEIKCPTSRKSLELCKEGLIEAHYFCQVQWALMISGATVMHFFVWQEKEHYLMEIEPNVEFQKLQLKAAQKFWEAVNGDFNPDPNYMVAEAKSMLGKIAIVASTGREYIEVQASTQVVNKAVKYKTTTKEIDEMMQVVKELKVQQDQLKRELIDEGDGANFILEGIKFCAVQPKDSVDWAKAVTELQFEITPEQLKKYTKKKNAYYRVTVLD